MIIEPLSDKGIDALMESLEGIKKGNIDYFDYDQIPERFMVNMKEYVELGEPLGGFLYAVFTNDLWAATASADHNNMPLIPVYVRYVHNNLPWTCHGSHEAVKEWMMKKQRERIANE